MSMDFSDLVAFEVELGDLPRETITNVRKGIEVAARATKDEMRGVSRGASGRHAKRYPSAMDYELGLKSDGEITAEVGPKIGGQGSLGFLDEAPGGVTAAPQHAARAAAKVAEKELIIGVLKALDEVHG